MTDTAVRVTVVGDSMAHALVLNRPKGLAKTLAIVLRNTRTRTPEAMSTSISSGLTTFDTVPSRPPPVTILSPRRTASIIARWSFCFCCCGRINRK